MDRIRGADVTAVVTPVFGIRALRALMVRKQRAIAARHPRLVTEGRDQGSVVFPDADVKIYLYADAKVRAERRAEQLRAAGQPADAGKLLQEIAERDRSDATRHDGPLTCPEGAHRVDTSGLSFEQVVDKLEYVDKVVKQFRNQEPLIDNVPYEYEGLSHFKMTLAQFLKSRTTYYRRYATGFVDSDLKYIFRTRPRLRNGQKIDRSYMHADNFLHRNQRIMVNRVSQWVGVDPLVVSDLILKCRQRTHALDLWVKQDEAEKKLVEFTTYVSTRCAYYEVWETYFP